MRLGLIPVGNGGVIVRTMICVAMLDRRLERLGKRNRRIKMKAVDAPTAAGKLSTHQRCAIEREAVATPTEIPRSEKIIFGACADERRRGRPIDEEHIVTLAPPSVLVLQDRHGYTDELPVPLRFHPDVVVFAIGIAMKIHHRIAILIPL